MTQTFTISNIIAIFVFLSSVSFAWNVPQRWPDSNVRKPKGFAAYPLLAGDKNACDVEILFQRDFNDQKYDYHVYGIYDGNKDPVHLPILNYREPDKLSLVNATPQGQRGAYFLKDSFTLTPLVVPVCHPGKKSPKTSKTPKSYFIKVVHSGKGSKSEAIWYSPHFNLTPSATIVPNTGVTKVFAKREKSQLSNSNKVHVLWHLTSLFNDQVKGFFILIGPKKGAKQVHSFFINDPNANETTVEIGYFVDNYAAFVVVLSKDGVLTNPELAPQVSIH